MNYSELNVKKKKKEEECEDESKRNFISSVSHEIRTPINGIIGMTKLLENTKLSPTQREYLETIYSCSIQLIELISDILDYSKMSSNELFLESKEFFVTDCIEEAHDIVTYLSEEKKIKVTYVIERSVPVKLIGDPKRIKQILVNLLTNGIKFTERGYVHTNICFKNSSSENSGFLKIEVIDTGIGIPLSEQENVFKAFHQLHANDTRGTGLGLGIVKKLTELLNGSCKLESRSLEDGHDISGTKMIIEFPLKTTNDFTSEKETKLKGKAVLLYISNITNRISVVNYCMNVGIIPYVAASLREFGIFMENQHESFFAILLDKDNDIEKEDIPDAKNVIYVISISDLRGVSENDLFLTKPIKCSKLLQIFLSLLGIKDDVLGKKKENYNVLEYDTERKWYRHHTKRKHFSVLVVEDNKANQKILYEFLMMISSEVPEQNWFFDVKTASSGDEALEICDSRNNKRFDLILMDLKMPPGMDGIKTTKEIRKNFFSFIVGLTATDSESEKKKCKKAGMDAYITKPILYEAFKELIFIIFNK